MTDHRVEITQAVADTTLTVVAEGPTRRDAVVAAVRALDAVEDDADPGGSA